MTTTTSSTSGDVATNNSTVSVASNSSSGAAGGSVIDVSSLVSQLVAATQDPQTALIDSKMQTVTTAISNLGTLKSDISTFQSSLTALSTPTAFNAQTATSSSAAVTATVSSGAPVGSYSVSVSQLASAQQLISGELGTSGSSTIGSGTLQLSLGGASFSVPVNSTDDTLNGLASAINAATGNPGITATVLSGTDGAHLVLTSTLSGASNTIGVTETDGGTALSGLTYGTTNTANYTQQAAAQDAEYTIAGVAGTSSSNTVEDALNGVTLTLSATTTTTTGTGSSATTSDTPVTVNVSTDTSTIEQNVSAFVTAYNTMVASFTTLGGYDSTTGVAGAMMGDATFTGIQSQIQNQLYSIVDTGSSTYNSLASIGITTNSDGTLSLNSTTLSNALSTNFSAVSSLFSGTTGVATGLNTVINNALSATGSISTRSSTLLTQENDLDDQTSQLSTQMAALSASLTQQYSALNSLLSSLQSTSSYLTQAFSSLPQVQSTQSA